MKIIPKKALSKHSSLRAQFALVFLFLTFSISYSQKVSQEVPPLRERIFFGGNFWLSFGTITDIQVAPVVGLWVLPRVAIAAGPNYRYYKYQDVKTSIYGAKAYLQYVLLRDLNNLIPIGVHTGIFFHIEDELLSLESSIWNSQNTADRFIINTLLIGGGISQQLGRRSSMNFMVLWALNDSEYEVYSNPEIRISFNF